MLDWLKIIQFSKRAG